MPMFFARRYLRAKPSLTERLIGGGILLLLALIAGAFLLTSGLAGEAVVRHPSVARLASTLGIEHKPLFVADPAALASAATQPEDRNAEMLLPVVAAPWQRLAVIAFPVSQGETAARAAREAQTAAADRWRDDARLWDAVERMGGRYVYRALYKDSAYERHMNVPYFASATVIDAGNPSGARKLYAQRIDGSMQPLALGCEGRTANTSGWLCFWAGRYYTEFVGSQSGNGTLEDVARVIAQQQLVYSDTGTEVQPTTGPSGVAPNSPTAGARFPEVGGDIVAPARIDRYTDNLYEKIDGREGQFRSFHFVELRVGQYLDTRKQQAFEAFLYDMAEPVNAMGIYSSERSEDAEPLAVGNEGYVSGENAYFWQSKYYVNVLGPADAGAEAAETARKIAAAISATIPEDKTSFWADELLPKADRLPNTFKFRATSALGYEFLENMYLADYETGGKKYSMFAMKAGDAAAAKVLFDKLAEATAKYDKVVLRQPSAGGETLIGESLGIYSVAFCRGPYLAGVVECEDQALATKQADALRERITGDGSDHGRP